MKAVNVTPRPHPVLLAFLALSAIAFAAPAASAPQRGFELGEWSYRLGECRDRPCVELAWPAASPSEDRWQERRIAGALEGWGLAPLLDGSAAGSAEAIAAEFTSRHPGLAAQRTWSLRYESRRILCLARRDEIHDFLSPPRVESATLLVDLRSGRPIELEDFFAPESMPALNERAERAFREEHGPEPGRSLSAKWSFDDGRFALPESFVVDEEAITFNWKHDEIGPGAPDAPWVTLPWAGLQDLLRPEAPMGRAPLPLILRIGEEWDVAYDSHPSTGYTMSFEIDDETVLALKEARKTREPREGVPGGDRSAGTWVFVAKSLGRTRLVIVYNERGRVREEVHAVQVIPHE